MREQVQTILDALRVTRASDTPRSHLLITAPHSSKEHVPLDDPCTEEVASGVAEYLRARCSLFLANVSRKRGDQNRLLGLLKTQDLLVRLNHFLANRGGDLRDVLHVDVHSYTCTDLDLPKGWGRGFNLICLRGDSSQLRLARRLAHLLTRALPQLPCAAVVAMPRLPCTLGDDNGNAMIEWSRHYGALSVLIEVPTVKRQGKYMPVCDITLVCQAITGAILSELTTVL